MRKPLLAILMALLLVIGGCTGEKDQMQRELADILNDVQDHEKEATEYEAQLDGLEKKEQLLFEKTMDLGIEEHELIESNVSRLETMLGERRELVNEEREAVLEAEETMKRLSELPKAESDEGTRAAAKLKTALEKRYELHHDVISLYTSLTDEQENVYGLLVDENVKRVKLEEATAAVNKKRAALEDAIRVFNQSTNEVNSALEETQQVESD